MTSRIAIHAEPDSVSDCALPAGTRFDEYEIESVLAHSSIAYVYLAYDRVLKQRVAIKEYLPSGLALRSGETRVALREPAYAQAFEHGRQAFVNEARVLAQCEHGSLLHITRILEHHDTVYRVMRYTPGPTLREYRRAMATTLDEKVLRCWLDSLLGALAELHAQGWVHAAVSPGNILMLPGDRPMLLNSDAVRAALISDRTRSMMAALEPCFAPIEQREPKPDRPLGPWTDLYALAATLRFCISGEWPEAPAIGSAAPLLEPLGVVWQRQHRGQPGPPPPPAWLSALDACLAESAQHRPQSVAQLRAMLDGTAGLGRWNIGATFESWRATGYESVGPAADRHPDAGPEQATARSGLEQTLPFIAARAHETVAAARSPASAPKPLAATPLHGRRPWMVGAALTLMVLAAVAAGEWMQGRREASSADGSALTSGPANEPLQAPAMSAPVTAIAYQPTGAGATGSGAPTAESPKPAPAALPGAALAAAPTTSQDGQRAPDSPRKRCGTRSGYALYQCMQTQCAKRDLARHAQCQRLRQDRSLG